ncbi:Rrf2 family transcriptional regulator [Caulobacter sp. 1776]|uniref:Rrf2 family transcriptional regulator n=1 Tax=Caulobacter sp. 1776 TaxID=3156420 RepID=UPI00339781E8
MRLTERTLLGLRIVAAVDAAGTSLTVDNLARLTHADRDHTSKVVHGLACAGLVATTRGRRGGVSARPGAAARPSAIVLALESCVPRQDCHPCPLAETCALPALTGLATEAFLAALDAGGLEAFRAPSDEMGRDALATSPLTGRLARRLGV